MDGSTVGHCEVLNGMGEWVERGRCRMGRLGCGDSWYQVDLGRGSTSPKFREPFGDPSLVCRVVLFQAAGGGFWGINTRRIPLSFPLFRIFYTWCPIRALVCAASTWATDGGHITDDSSSSALSMTTLILLSGQTFRFSCYASGDFLHARYPPSGCTPDGGLHRIVFVSDVFLIGCSSITG